MTGICRERLLAQLYLMNRWTQNAPLDLDFASIHCQLKQSLLADWGAACVRVHGLINHFVLCAAFLSVFNSLSAATFYDERTKMFIVLESVTAIPSHP